MPARLPKPIPPVTVTVTTNADDRRAHLGMLQGVITRLASNSFYVKGWSVTVTGALLALAAREDLFGMALVAMVPVLAFWAMDTNFLALEAQYRQLFDQARRNEVEVYHMKALRATWTNRLTVAGSWSVALVHGALLLATGIVAILLWEA